MVLASELFYNNCNGTKVGLSQRHEGSSRIAHGRAHGDTPSLFPARLLHHLMACSPAVRALEHLTFWRMRDTKNRFACQSCGPGHCSNRGERCSCPNYAGFVIFQILTFILSLGFLWP